MLSQERISAGKLKQAYDLNDREVEALLRTLWPDHIFPFQLWNEARKTFWFGAYDFYMDRFKVKNFNDCEQDLAVSDDFFSLNRTGDKAYILFHDLARLIFSETLRKGLDYILEETYATTPEELKNDIDLFFESLAEAEEPVNKYGNRHLTLEQYQGVLDSKIDIPTKRHFSFSKLFPDTVVVNKSAAIRHLFNCGYPLQREVKGISQAIVDHITATPKTDTAKTPPDAAIAVSSSLWKGKSPQAIRNGMRDDGHSDAVIAFVLSEWCNKSKTLIGRLLSKEQDMADSSYRKLTTRLLAEAAAQTIIKFPPEDSPK